MRPATDPVGTSGSLAAGERLAAIDLLRGLVIALMALDHTRDFFHSSAHGYDPLDPAHTTIALYLTRWVTHFCAPTFVFLSGVSVYLQSVKGKGRVHLSLFLLTRGIWLIFLELTVIRFGWEFAFGLPFLQVIWAIGASMVLLAGVVWLPRGVVLAIGVAIIAGHNLFDGVKSAQLGEFGPLWTLLENGGSLQVAGTRIVVVYAALPWTGVMALGYGLGALFLEPQPARDRKLALLGLALIVAFVVLRLINTYGDPRPWAPHGDLRATLMDFFDVLKYPPSLMFVCVTLGPVLMAFPLIGRFSGMPARVLLAYGSVPLFAYVLHIYLVHALALIAAVATGHDAAIEIDQFSKYFAHPELYSTWGFPLWVVYAVWLVVLTLLYPASAWWAGVKKRRRDWWLSYL